MTGFDWDTCDGDGYQVRWPHPAGSVERCDYCAAARAGSDLARTVMADLRKGLAAAQQKDPAP